MFKKTVFLNLVRSFTLRKLSKERRFFSLENPKDKLHRGSRNL